jgi:hypothetical protein
MRVSGSPSRSAAAWQRARLAANRTTPPRTVAAGGVAPLLGDDERLAAVRAQLTDLEARGRLTRVAGDPHLVVDGIHLAALNFRRAVRQLDDPDVAVVFLYQSVVNTADAVLHCLGYHARDFEGHKLAIAVTTDLVAALHGRSRSRVMARTSERLRKRRHEALYSRSGVVTGDEARAALEDCRRYLPRLWALAGRLVGVPDLTDAALMA